MIEIKHDGEAPSRATHGNALAAALGTNMSRWFQPTAENFFDHISKPNIIEALREAGKEAGEIRKSMKKAQLAKVAEANLSKCGWLPKPLRIENIGESNQNNPVKT